MTEVNRFLSERAAQWSELEGLLDRAKGRPERLGAEGVLRLGTLYRAAAADLAHARRRLPGDPATGRLEALVARGHQAVYADASHRSSVRRFLATGYWQLVAARRGAVALATLLLVAPAVLAGLWVGSDPGAALGLVPPEFRGAVEPVGDTGMSGAETARFSSEVLTNNIQVTLLAWAAGLLLGLGTAFVVLYNGVILGVIAGGAIQAGNGVAFVEFVAAHGIIELSCIVVAAAAGLRMGWAIVAPGTQTRGQSLVAEARDGVAIVLGTAPWLVLAGLIEGFVTRSGFGLVGGLVLGVAVGAAYWTLVVVRGRARPEPATST
jgi:uncharacterized membrane protein SpoIIM required for sporulation